MMRQILVAAATTLVVLAIVARVPPVRSAVGL